MVLDLVDYEQKARAAVRAFWRNREAARQKQSESGKADQGERAGVTSGKNMDGFVALVRDIVRANGLADADIHQQRAVSKAHACLPAAYAAIDGEDLSGFSVQGHEAAILAPARYGNEYSAIRRYR